MHHLLCLSVSSESCTFTVFKCSIWLLVCFISLLFDSILFYREFSIEKFELWFSRTSSNIWVLWNSPSLHHIFRGLINTQLFICCCTLPFPVILSLYFRISPFFDWFWASDANLGSWFQTWKQLMTQSTYVRELFFILLLQNNQTFGECMSTGMFQEYCVMQVSFRPINSLHCNDDYVATWLFAQM